LRDFYRWGVIIVDVAVFSCFSSTEPLQMFTLCYGLLL
jgi:hypothetical protein